jgi:hypothetical protein
MKKIISVLCVCAVFALPQSTTSAHIDDDIPLRFDTYQDYAHHVVVSTWGEEYWEYFDKIIIKESGWNHTAQNPTSSAYGLCQTMMSLHDTEITFKDDGFQQIDWCVNYISTRYGNPAIAWNFHIQNNWF